MLILLLLLLFAIIVGCDLLTALTSPSLPAGVAASWSLNEATRDLESERSCNRAKRSEAAEKRHRAASRRLLSLLYRIDTLPHQRKAVDVLLLLLPAAVAPVPAALSCVIMDGVKPLYAAVQSSVLSSLRREWQRYGWEESEIEEKISRLSELWNSRLQATGAVTEPGAHLLAAPSAGEEEAEDGKDEGGDGSKRRRKSGDKPGEKRFKVGPRINAPLSYPAPAPAHASASAAASSASLPAQQTVGVQRPAPPQPPVQQAPLSIPAYVPRSSMILPLSSASSPLSRIPQLDGSHDDQPPALPLAAGTDAAAAADTAASSSSLSSLSAPDPSFLLTAAAESNPLLSDPLSSLDDLESDGEQLELGRVRDLMLCQYERVSHTKNRWKVVLRDGIMQIKGKDYVFSRATGELLW